MGAARGAYALRVAVLSGLTLDHGDNATAAAFDDVVPVADEHDLTIPHTGDQAFQGRRAIDEFRDRRRHRLPHRYGNVLLHGPDVDASQCLHRPGALFP
jgi:hypothetical protein